VGKGREGGKEEGREGDRENRVLEPIPQNCFWLFPMYFTT
jgi:hypothetical protein